MDQVVVVVRVSLHGCRVGNLSVTILFLIVLERWNKLDWMSNGYLLEGMSRGNRRTFEDETETIWRFQIWRFPMNLVGFLGITTSHCFFFVCVWWGDFGFLFPSNFFANLKMMGVWDINLEAKSSAFHWDSSSLKAWRTFWGCRFILWWDYIVLIKYSPTFFFSRNFLSFGTELPSP